MAEEAVKPWKDIRINECDFQGTIVGDPTFNAGYGFATLRTVYLLREQNGQFVERDVDIPLIVLPGNDNIMSTLQRHIKTGRKLHVKCEYMAWSDNGTVQHYFSVMRWKLGSKPYEKPGDAGSPGGFAPPA